MRKVFLVLIIATSTTADSQNIGIGTTTPGGKLQINHRSSLLSPGLILMDSTGSHMGNIRFMNVSSGKFIQAYGFTGYTYSADTYLDITSDSAFIATFQGNGQVGIGTLSPTAKLDVEGDIKSTILTGTGFRQLFADATGRIVTRPLATGNVSVNPKAFTKNSSTPTSLIVTDGHRAYLGAGATDEIGAPVNLPNGATITGIRFVCQDRSAANDLELSLIYANSTDIGISIITSVTTSGSSIAFRTFTAATNHVVDNFNNFYSIQITPVAGQTWDGSILAIRGIVITYNY